MIEPCKTKNAAYHVLARCLRADGRIQVLDYQEASTFADLWCNALKSENSIISGINYNFADPQTQILIVGCEPPPELFKAGPTGLGEVSYAEHFTALSWLAAWKLKFAPSEEQRKNRIKEPGAQIAVIDFSRFSKLHATGRSLRSLFASRSGCGATLVPRAILIEPSLQAILDWSATARQDRRDTPAHITELLGSAIWNGLTSTAERHHAVSNMLGPLLLSRQADTESVCPETLLQKLLTACGLVSWQSTPHKVRSPRFAMGGESSFAAQDAQQQASQHGQRTPVYPGDSAELGDGLQLLLVDDQAEHGWLKWVNQVLPNAEVEYLTDPSALVEALTLSLRGETGAFKRDCRFKLALPKLSTARNPVLLLDLRLFSGRPEVEGEFFKDQLLPLVRHFTDKPGVAWPTFSAKDEIYQSTLRHVQNGTLEVDSTEHREALTWLPRVLALCEMSLPIILFSSTGRRDVIEPLKQFANIITHFAKPRLADLKGAEDPGFDARLASIQDLREAVRGARAWLRTRASGQRVMRVDLSPLHRARDLLKNKRHFEIYHDESGEVEKGGFKVLSILSAFPDAKSADLYDSAFPRWFCGTGSQKKRLRDDPAMDIAQLHQDSEKDRWATEFWPSISKDPAPYFLAACVRDPETARTGAPESLFDPEGLDNINWDLLSLLWESLLADVLPALLQDRSPTEAISINIYGATRFRPLRLEGSSPNEAIEDANRFLKTAWDKWGLDLLWSCYVKDERRRKVSFPDKFNGALGVNRDYEGGGREFTLYWSSLKQDSFWRLVSEVLFSRKRSLRFKQISCGIECARGETLLYGESYGHQHTEVRSQHYLADLAGLLVDVDLKSHTITVASDAQPFSSKNECRLAVTAFRDRLIAILNANRLLDLGSREAEAILAFESLVHDHSPDIAYLALAERLQKCLQSITGGDLERLRTLIQTGPNWLTANVVQVPDRIETRRKQQPVIPASPSPVACQVAAEQVNAPMERWLLRRFQNPAAYLAANVDWHRLPGYHVRIASTGMITVFADLEVIKAQDLSPEFIKPAKTSFKPDGSLLGREWTPSNLSPKSSSQARVPPMQAPERPR